MEKLVSAKGFKTEKEVLVSSFSFAVAGRLTGDFSTNLSGNASLFPKAT